MRSYINAEDVRPIVGTFNAEAVCPKCGGADLFTRHAEGDDGCGQGCHPAVPERLVRRCVRCRYSWWELPVAAPVEGEDQ